ncbi:nucleotidyltransferase domain-containing protein [Nonomuraea sp. MG754425]|uniref:nucleotidyltransferase domain-containing protein n=1 Tax=Nonomuraea sp. MG754425 TaxID=2570319 RepID=UPI001F221D4B|nr:nucleotidyltransferase domain-containing protein [Nonomuraea sp. MG754425]MCF6472687.1 nucleotidyltransferase domain-containing protein [Nonomuraea sp. MG754425]
MLAQERLITRVRDACHADPRLEAALMYGSFAQGEGDTHSDIEFWLFFTPEGRAEVDPAAWCAQVAPLRHLVVNEFGTHVAFFPDLLRGEFHFATGADIAQVRAWPARGAPVERMLVLDRGGRLGEALAAVPEQPAVVSDAGEALALCGRMANWLVLAHHVNERGEVLRALDALAHAHRHLLWLARLAENRTGHWLTPSRAAEADLPAHALAALAPAVATAATREEVRRAVQAAWRCGRDCWQRLAGRYDTPVPQALFDDLDHATGLR